MLHKEGQGANGVKDVEANGLDVVTEDKQDGDPVRCGTVESLGDRVVSQAG